MCNSFVYHLNIPKSTFRELQFGKYKQYYLATI